MKYLYEIESNRVFYIKYFAVLLDCRILFMIILIIEVNEYLSISIIFISLKCSEYNILNLIIYL